MNIKVVGNTAVIATTITPAQIEKVKKLKPELLTVKDEKGQPLFRMDSLKSGTGTINANGVEFVPGVDDTLVVTLSLPTGTTEGQAKEAIFKVAAKAKVYIEQIEDTVDDQIDDIIAAEKAFLESIEIG